MTHTGGMTVATQQLSQDETAAVTEVIDAVRPQFPAFIRDAVFQFRTDHVGDPVVWVWLILDDDTEIESRAVQAEITPVHRALFDRLLESVPGRWPFISVRLVSDQQARVTRGSA